MSTVPEPTENGGEGTEGSGSKIVRNTYVLTCAAVGTIAVLVVFVAWMPNVSQVAGTAITVIGAITGAAFGVAAVSARGRK